MSSSVLSKTPGDGTELPPLSESDFRTYNRLAVIMDQYHNHFRHEWTTLWNACSPAPDTKPMSARSMITLGLSFLSHLTMHHDIEETYFFPLLAKRMDFFKPEGVHPQQHKEIHKGIDALDDYLKSCREGSRDFKREEVKACMQKWGDVLWTHLAEEVQTLGALNMRKYWTLEEMHQMPI